MSAEERELHLAWQQHVGVGPTADRWFDEVVGMHRATGRHYHDLRHVRWVVRHARDLARDRSLPTDAIDRLVAAGFFHDAVYDARRNDNEARSAALAERALAELGWQVDVIVQVSAMILATATHVTDGPGAEETTSVLLAADLGVLSAEPSRYGDYVRAVRREYAHLDDDTWTSGRAAFVRSMLDREAIYPPSLGLDAWERRARANLTAELAAVGAISGGAGEDGAHEP
jgi:predicted metal-dependent HD superfamily phosphohydrolase